MASEAPNHVGSYLRDRRTRLDPAALVRVRHEDANFRLADDPAERLGLSTTARRLAVLTAFTAGAVPWKLTAIAGL